MIRALIASGLWTPGVGGKNTVPSFRSGAKMAPHLAKQLRLPTPEKRNEQRVDDLRQEIIESVQGITQGESDAWVRANK